jgi:hypothetical protein
VDSVRLRFSNYFPSVRLSQFKTCTPTRRCCKYQRLLSGHLSSGMFRRLASLKSSDLPTDAKTTLCKPQISKLLLFKFNAIRLQRTVCISIRTVKQHLAIHLINAFTLHFNTPKTILIWNVIIKNIIPKFLSVLSGKVRVPTGVRVPPF